MDFGLYQSGNSDFVFEIMKILTMYLQTTMDVKFHFSIS